MLKWMKVSGLVLVSLLAACEQSKPSAELSVVVGNVVAPATQHSLLAAFTAALPCGSTALTWRIREQSIGWTALDGSITQDGLWVSPSCGSAWLGQVLHVEAACPATGQVAVATIATVPEQVAGVELAYAVIANPGAATCLAPNAASPTVQAGGAVQYYARVRTTCGEIVTPTPPSAWPPVCP